MKIAIQGHPTRGKEVIQILKDLGGKGSLSNFGYNEKMYYWINSNNIILESLINIKTKKEFILYTLEEFEKEFPFKVGDLCIYSSDILGENIVVRILGMTIENDCIMYEVGHRDIIKEHSHIYRKIETLKPYKEMKEERNVTLTFDKAKEWYKKGGELREIALQAFTEKELNPLPRSWEEFATNYARRGYYISSDGKPLMCASSGKFSSPHVCPSKKSAEAHLAMIQLEQLRDCWRQGWKPDKWNNGYCIVKYPEKYVVMTFGFTSFLSFPTREMAEEFIECFRDLMEKAGDLI